LCVDIGNSGIKLGRFARATDTASSATNCRCRLRRFELPIEHTTGAFDTAQLAEWCTSNVGADTRWSIAASIERQASAGPSDQWWARQLGTVWPIRRLAPQDLPMPIRVVSRHALGSSVDGRVRGESVASASQAAS